MWLTWQPNKWQYVARAGKFYEEFESFHDYVDLVAKTPGHQFRLAGFAQAESAVRLAGKPALIAAPYQVD